LPGAGVFLQWLAISESVAALRADAREQFDGMDGHVAVLEVPKSSCCRHVLGRF
jgi:hypothetical protein